MVYAPRDDMMYTDPDSIAPHNTTMLARVLIAFTRGIALPFPVVPSPSLKAHRPTHASARAKPSISLLDTEGLSRKDLTAGFALARDLFAIASVIRPSVPLAPASVGTKPSYRTLPADELSPALYAYDNKLPVDGGSVTRSRAVEGGLFLALVHGVAFPTFLAQQSDLRTSRRMEAFTRTVAGRGGWSCIGKRLAAMGASGSNRNCHRKAILSAKDTQHLGWGAGADARRSVADQATIARCYYSIFGFRTQDVGIEDV